MKKKKAARKTMTLAADLHKRLKIAAVNWNWTLESLLDDAVRKLLTATRIDK